jgi:hypothetical protein
MLELPALLLGLWCNPVRWQLDSSYLIYSRSVCWQGDNFLQVDKQRLASSRATCDITKVVRLGEGRWIASGEMAFSAWNNCGDGATTWQQKITFLENRHLKVLSDWVVYSRGYTGPGRTLIRW